MERFEAKVERLQVETPDVTTIYFSVPERDFSYTAGQYITVFFEDSSTPEGKAYSFSSAPHEPLKSITVKKVGEYSGRLHDLRVGDTFLISAAYGSFNPQSDAPLVGISAGCALAPIWSIVKDELHKKPDRKINLFVSSKTVAELVFADRLADYENKFINLKIHRHITRQAELPNGMRRGRIDLDACVEIGGTQAAYAICGSVDFVRSMWRGLVDRGLDGGSISTETFFE